MILHTQVSHQNVQYFSAKALRAIETLTKCGTNDFGSNGDQVRKFARDALAMILIDNQSYDLLHEQYNLGEIS